MDYNGIYPEDINLFLRKFLEHVIDGKIPAPEYVVGCACGSSEIVMPLAGVLGADLGFIRRSHRRGDMEPRIVDEQEPAIREGVEGSDTVCVEDYVCSSRSLFEVMKQVREYNPSVIFGASVNNSEPPSYLDRVVRKRKFHLFTMEDGCYGY